MALAQVLVALARIDEARRMAAEIIEFSKQHVAASTQAGTIARSALDGGRAARAWGRGRLAAFDDAVADALSA